MTLGRQRSPAPRPCLLIWLDLVIEADRIVSQFILVVIYWSSVMVPVPNAWRKRDG
jgi:hypothetical protein